VPPSLEGLESRLGHQFHRLDFLSQALTHRSHGKINNERLEFLGDAILNFVIADALYQQFPTAHEGQLSRLRAHLVREQTLAEIAREISLGDHLTMGTGELRSGSFNRDSILSDALEAIMGAIYQDSDLDTTREKILDWFSSRIARLSLENLHKDAKSRLQEFLQARQAALPIYVVTEMSGEEHNRMFHVECRCELLEGVTKGQGGNRRVAEQIAATRALELLGVTRSGVNGG